MKWRVLRTQLHLSSLLLILSSCLPYSLTKAVGSVTAICTAHEFNTDRSETGNMGNFFLVAVRENFYADF